MRCQNVQVSVKFAACFSSYDIYKDFSIVNFVSPCQQMGYRNLKLARKRKVLAICAA